jgi:hypothetical protein
MSKCDTCAFNSDGCIESCIDCECASCTRHDDNDFCGLGMVYDRYESEDGDE